jgi:hypothetical protein
VIEFLVAKKESVRNIHRCLYIVCGSAAVVRSTTGCWVKRVVTPETGKVEYHDLSWSGRPVTVVVLKCCSMVMPVFTRIDTSQSDNWSSVFHSAKEVLVASPEISGYSKVCVR